MTTKILVLKTENGLLITKAQTQSELNKAILGTGLNFNLGTFQREAPKENTKMLIENFPIDNYDISVLSAKMQHMGFKTPDLNEVTSFIKQNK